MPRTSFIVSWAVAIDFSQRVPGARMLPLALQLGGPLEPVLERVQRLADRVVKLAGDALALLLLGVHQSRRQRRELAALLPQPLLGRGAPRDLVLQLAVRLGQFPRPLLDPRFELRRHRREPLLGQLEFGDVLHDQHGTGGGRVLRRAVRPGMRPRRTLMTRSSCRSVIWNS